MKTRLITPDAQYMIDTHTDVQRKKDIRASLAVVKEAWVENVYQIQSKDFYDTGIFIDLGANVGATTFFVHSLLRKPEINLEKTMIYAYEPEPKNFKYLINNIDLNKAKGITPINKAIWNKPKLEITTSGSGSTCNKKEGEETVIVPAVTLEQVFEENNIKECDVLKMDIEHAEYKVLCETDIDTLRRIKYLTMEFHKTDLETFGKCIAKLAEVFNLHVIGRPTNGGQIYGKRY